MVHPPVVWAKLLLEGRPGDKSVAFWVDTVQPLRQPGVNIEPHSGVCKGRQISLIEGYGVLFQAFEILVGEPNGRGPKDPLPFVFLKPEFKHGNDVGLMA